jgi:DNA polymerase-3 subunit alpha
MKATKSNNMMAFITLEDLFGTMEIIVFPKTYEKFSALIIEENIVTIKGRISLKEDENPKIVCEDIKPLKRLKSRKLYIKVNEAETKTLKSSLISLLKYFKGNIPVYLYDSNSDTVEVMDRECWVNLNDELINELKSRLGEDNVKVV